MVTIQQADPTEPRTPHRRTRRGGSGIFPGDSSRLGTIGLGGAEEYVPDRVTVGEGVLFCKKIKDRFLGVESGLFKLAGLAL
jgi:hypothetical protein